jgi:hypothetical protein
MADNILAVKDDEFDKLDLPSDEPKAHKFTDWKKEPKVEDLRKDITDSASEHSMHITNVTNWLDALFVRGKHQPAKSNTNSRVQPKIIRRQAEWRYASLVEPFLSTDDLFNIDPVAHDDMKAAEQNQLLLNNQLNTRMNKTKFIGDYVRTAVNEGTVVCKVSWVFEEQEIEIEVPNYVVQMDESESTAEIIGGLIKEYKLDSEVFNANTSPEWIEAVKLTMVTGTPHAPVEQGTKKSTEMVTKRNHPYVEVLGYDEVIVDPTCKGDLDKANFVIHIFDTSMGELKKAGIYKNLDLIDVSSAESIGSSDTENRRNTTFQFSDKTRKKLRAHEYWGYYDVNGDGVLVPIVATFVGSVMIRLEKNPYPDQKLPFILVQYLPVVGSVYGEADASLLEDNQRVIGAVTRGCIDLLARSANSQIGYRKDALDYLNKRKLINGEDYEFNPNVNPDQAFYMHKVPEIPNSALTLLGMQNQDVEAMTGVKSFNQGMTGASLGSTAIGVRSAMDATAKRDMDILRRLAKGIEDIGRKMISMNAVFLDEVEVIRITNKTFVPIRRDDLLGNFDLRLTISTAEADNQKAEELAFMLQTLGNSVDFNITKMLLSDIAKLRKMPTLAKRIEEYTPEPDPLAVQEQQLKIALLQAQIQESEAKAQHWLSGVDKNVTGAQLDNAKARKTNSEADKADLDFVQEETGTNHARALEQTKAQAEGNIQLEAVKAMLNPPKNETSA